MFVNNDFFHCAYRMICLFQIAIDIDNEAKEHNRFLDSMVMKNLAVGNSMWIVLFLAFWFRYCTKFSRWKFSTINQCHVQWERWSTSDVLYNHWHGIRMFTSLLCCQFLSSNLINSKSLVFLFSDQMKLIIHQILRGIGRTFPLKIQARRIEKISVDYNRHFIVRIVQKIDYDVLRRTVRDVSNRERERERSRRQDVF